MFPTSSSPEARCRKAPYLSTARAVLITLVLALLAACGQQTPPSIALELDANTVELLRGAPETEVLVTITRTGSATGDVELALTGLPADVTATFSPAVLSGTDLTSTLTLNAPAEASEGYHALDVTATTAGLEANASLNVAVVGLTVTGQLQGLITGPLAGFGIASQDDTAITDSNGRFTLNGLSVPYDITAWSAADQRLHVYEGLTESEVALSTLLTGTPTASYTTTISGSLTGDHIPVAANHQVVVCFEGAFGLFTQCDTVDPTESSFSLSPVWAGSASRSSRLHLLHVETDGSGMPVAYPGYLSLEIDLKDGLPVVFTDPLDLGDELETITVALEIDTSAAVTLTGATVQVGPELAIPVMSRSSGDTSYDVIMPVIPATSFTFLSANNSEIIGWTAGVTGSEATIVMPQAPTVTAPTDGATGVTTTTDFIASNPSGGPLTWLWSSGSLAIGLTSMDTTVNMPDPAGYGFTVPGGTNLELTLLASGGTSVEAGARALNDYFTALLFGATAAAGFPSSGSLAIGSPITITTAP